MDAFQRFLADMVVFAGKGGRERNIKQYSTLISHFIEYQSN